MTTKKKSKKKKSKKKKVKKKEDWSEISFSTSELTHYDWITDTTEYYSIKYKVGTMVIMPSFLLHSSEVNLSDERKRVISWDMRAE